MAYRSALPSLELAFEYFADAYLVAADKGPGEVTRWIRRDQHLDDLADVVTSSLTYRGIPESWIREKSQAKMSALLGSVNQDIGVYHDGKPSEPLVSVNLKSQMSSFSNNRSGFRNNLMGEVTNLHAGHPGLACGLIYILPTHGFASADDAKIERPPFEAHLAEWADWRERTSATDKEFLYEAKLLLVVDFDPYLFEGGSPYICTSAADLAEHAGVDRSVANRVPSETFDPDAFFDTLLEHYHQRFG